MQFFTLYLNNKRQEKEGAININLNRTQTCPKVLDNFFFSLIQYLYTHLWEMQEKTIKSFPKGKKKHKKNTIKPQKTKTSNSNINLSV